MDRVKNAILSCSGVELGALLDLASTTKTRLDTEYDVAGAEADMITEYLAEQGANPDAGIPATLTALNRTGTAWATTADIERSSNPMGKYESVRTWMEKLGAPVFVQTANQDSATAYHTLRQVNDLQNEMQTFYDMYATLDARFTL